MTALPATDPVSVRDTSAPEPTPRTFDDESAGSRRLGAPAEHVAVALALGWWVFPLAHGSGGRDATPMYWGLLLMVPALVITARAQRWVSALLASALAVAALLVCVLAPTGWDGAPDAAGYAYVAALFLVVVGYARTTARRAAVAVAIAIAGIDQFWAAFVPWMGGGDPAHPMVGTFYWHNPYAAYLLAPALLGLVLAITGEHRALRLVGWVAAPLAAAGIVFSTSRAMTAVLAVGFAFCGLAALRSGRRTLLRYVAVMAVCAVVTLGLSGPPVFDHWRTPTSGASQRAADGESVATNGTYRTQFWREAIAVARAHPVTGAGFRSLGDASQFTSEPGWARSTQAHNGILQAAADGGLVLGLPVGLGTVVLALGCLRLLWRRRLRFDKETALGSAASLATLGLLAHSMVDLDWSYPAAFAMTAAAGGLALATDRATGAGRHVWAHRRPSAVPMVALVLAALVICAVSLPAWRAADRLAHHGAAAPAVTDAALADRAAGIFGSYLPAEALLRRAAQGQPVDARLLRTAVRRTAAAATVSPSLAILRARALVELGDVEGAIRAVDRVLAELGPTRARVVARDAAVTLALAGRLDRGRLLLGPELVRDLTSGADPAVAWLDVTAAQTPGLVPDSLTRTCLIAAATALGPAPAAAPAPVPAGGRVPPDCAVRIAELRR